MVRHWFRLRGPNWRRSMVINATGATLTAVVTIVIAWTKFHEGSWIVLVVTPIIVGGFLLIKGHYQLVKEEMMPETPIDYTPFRCTRSCRSGRSIYRSSKRWRSPARSRPG